MAYIIGHKTDQQAYLVRLLSGPQAGQYGFAAPQAELGEPVVYTTWMGACKAASMHGGRVVPVEEKNRE